MAMHCVSCQRFNGIEAGAGSISSWVIIGVIGAGFAVMAPLHAIVMQSINPAILIAGGLGAIGAGMGIRDVRRSRRLKTALLACAQRLGLRRAGRRELAYEGFVNGALLRAQLVHHVTRTGSSSRHRTPIGIQLDAFSGDGGYGYACVMLEHDENLERMMAALEPQIQSAILATKDQLAPRRGGP